MNIFFLDKDPTIAASYHNDKHCVKMILETAQILSTNIRLITKTIDIPNENLYKATHVNHPSVVWARTNQANALWTYNLGRALLAEYTRRYGKEHKSTYVFDNTLNYSDIYPEGELSLPALCMPVDILPEKYDNVQTAVDSYRKYYIIHKSTMANWKTKKPEWYQLN